MDKDKIDKKQIDEWKRNPLINLADSVNRSMVGDWSALANGGCLFAIITLVIIIGGGLLLLSRCSIY